MEEVEALRRHWAESRSAGWIGVELGRSRNSVISKIHGLRRQGVDMQSRRTGRQTLSRAERLEIGNRRRVKAGKPVLEALPSIAAVVPLQSGDVEPKLLALAELDARQCRWPYGDGPFRFCGHGTELGVPYCAKHSQIAYRDPPTAAEQAAARATFARGGQAGGVGGMGSGQEEKPATAQSERKIEVAG